MKTFYDEQAGSPPSGLMARFYDGQQDHLRSRVAYTEFYEDAFSTLTNAVYYSYDIHGNVKEMVTDDPTLDDLGDDARFKHLAYGYDLISGKVNYVSYQAGKPDQFWHHYEYDADNRLTVAETSSDSTLWERDAKYFYYLHGPLARTEIGHDKVQGQDYAYTLHGWIKGVNSNTLVATRDMGEDGRIDGANITASDLNGGIVLTGKINNLVAQDVFGYTLGYYENDYHSISPSTFDAVGHASSPLNSSTTDLFNGNISNWVMAMENTSEARLKTFGKLFAYDQLNRIKTSDVYNDISGATDNVLNDNSFAGAGAAFDYHEDFNYDPNGNILEANRNGNFIGGSNPMDNLTYYYKRSGGGTYQWSYNTSTHLNDLPSDATNQLDHVDETASGTGSYSGDVEDQLVTNYTYDAIGNLESDLQEEIANIEWTVFGKIRKITRTGTSDKPDLEFRYNAMGNRICKIVKPKDPGTHLVLDQRDWTYTYYTHDASGNVMAVYDRDLSDNGSNVDDKITLKEQDLYASSRVGLKRPLNDDGSAIVISGFTFTPGTPGGDGIIPVSATVGSIASSSLPSGMRWMTRKQYELSNHLGNVYAVVSDKKIGNANSLSTTAVAYYTADVISATDYFAFGAPENGREFSSTDYRFGFNGKENDNETVGTGEGTQDYGMRIYNPGLGRFLSVDPLTKGYPWFTPYQFAGNMPICAIDLDGEEQKIVVDQADVTFPIGIVTAGDVIDGQVDVSSTLNYTLTNQQIYSDPNHCECPEGAILQYLFPTIETMPQYGKLYITPTGAQAQLYKGRWIKSINWQYTYEELNADGSIKMDANGNPIQKTGEYIDYPDGEFMTGPVVQTDPTTPNLQVFDPTMFGAMGVQTPSKSFNFRNSKDKERIDIENPNPGKAPANIHYQNEVKNEKYYYDHVSKKFYNDKEFKDAISDTRNKELLENNQVQKYLKKALKYLGEKE